MPPSGPPSSPPPVVTPSRPTTTYIVDCLYSFAYIWPKIIDPFWFYPISVQSYVVAGYYWTGRSWTYARFNPDLIIALACYPVPTLY